MKASTTAIIASRGSEHGALVPPVHLSSTFEIEPGQSDPTFAYQRVANPSRATLERVVASIEEARWGFAFSTGMAATAAAFSTLSAGEHAIVLSSVYGGTYRFAKHTLPAQGVDVTFVDAPASLGPEHFRDTTSLVFIETPTNPTLRVVDIRRVALLAHEYGALLAVDNTFMTPLLQRPLELGADLVVQSATKFLAGHSDLLAGIITTNNETLAEAYHLAQKNWGGVLDPTSSIRLVQSIKTLPLRLREQQKNTRALIDFFASHPRVARVHFPGSASEDERAIHEAQASGLGAVFSIEFDESVDWKVFGASLEIAPFAVSLGDVSTLLVHPASTTHEDMSPEELATAGITDGLIRIAVGIEDATDLIADFTQAIERSTRS